MTSTAEITRVGTTTGRWPRYRLLVGGKDVGEIRRTVAKGYDRSNGRHQATHDGWAIAGTICTSRDEAERRLIERAVKFGHLPNGNEATA